MLKRFKYFPQEHRDKFLKMLLMLFPNFRSARFKDDGTIVLKQRGWFKRKIKRSFTDLLTYDIPREISLFRAGNYSLVEDFYDSIKEISKSNLSFEIKIQKTIDCLYDVFYDTKIRNVYNGVDIVVIPNDSTINTTKLVDTNSYMSIGDENSTMIQDIVEELKLITATWLITISLWLPFKSQLLHSVVTVVAEIRTSNFLWEVNYPT